MVAERLEVLTVSDDNHFTEYDIMCALKTYYLADEKAYRRRTEFISKKTGIPLTPNKRNGRKKADHVKYMNNLRKFKTEMGECTNGGRPDKENIVKDYVLTHPSATVTEISKALNISRTTVYKYLKSN